MKPFLFRFLCWLSSVSMLFAVTQNVTKESTTNQVNGALSIPVGGSAIYFSPTLTATGSGTATNPYGCAGRSLNSVVTAAAAPTYSSLILLPGTYTVSSTVTITTGQTLMGLSQDGTILKNYYLYPASAIVTAVGNDTTIKNFTIDMNSSVMQTSTNSGYSAINLLNGSNKVLDSVSVKNAFASALVDASVITAYNQDYNQNMNGIVIRNCTLYPPANNNIQGSIVLVNAASSLGFYTTGVIENCTILSTITNSFKFGAGSYGAKNCVIRNNYFETSSYGIFSDTPPNINTQYLQNNYVLNRTNSIGIYINTDSTNSYVISGNSFTLTDDGTNSCSFFADISGTSKTIVKNNNITSARNGNREGMLSLTNNSLQFIGNSFDANLLNGAIAFTVTNTYTPVLLNNFFSNGSFSSPFYATNQTQLNNSGSYTLRVPTVTASGAFVSIPPRFSITSIAITNATANAVTGGLNIGTTALGNDVVSAIAVGANASVIASGSTLLLQTLSNYTTVTPTALYISPVTAWNSASVDVTITVTPNF